MTLLFFFSASINAWLQSIISWCRPCNPNIHEELSCSYQPSMKKREDVVYVDQEFPSVSDDVTSCDSSSTKNYDDYEEAINDVIDAHELKHRLHATGPSYSRRYVVIVE